MGEQVCTSLGARVDQTQARAGGTMSQTLRQVFEVYIRTTPDKLWETLTNGDLTKLYFFGGVARSDWKAGSAYEFVDEDGDTMHFGEVIESVAPRKLVYTFNAGYRSESDRDPASRVTYEIAPAGEACKLTVLHEHYAGETETSKGTFVGWNQILSGLKTLLETGRPLQLPSPEETPA
ncbi:ATPase [bacterium]|nr:MAG: ATPase [bacterium]